MQLRMPLFLAGECIPEDNTKGWRKRERETERARVTVGHGAKPTHTDDSFVQL